MYLIVFLAVLALGLVIYARFGRGAGKLSELGRKLPLLRGVSRKISTSRFISAISLMLASGYDTRAALDIIPNILTNEEIKQGVEKIKTEVDEGVSMADAIKNSGIFSGIYLKMLTIGFRTGSIDTVSKEISELYEEDVSISLNNFIGILEPTLVICLAVVIGIILLSVMLPLIGIMSSMA